MGLKSRIFLIGFVLLLLSLVAVPIHSAHRVYHQSYADVVRDLIVDHRIGP